MYIFLFWFGLWAWHFFLNPVQSRFFTGLSRPVIQRVYLVRWGKTVHVGNRFSQRDVLLLFAQLLQILFVQPEHVRFEFGGILGEGALLLNVTPDVVGKQLVCVSMQLIPELLKRIAVLGVQLQILFDLALLPKWQVLKLLLRIAAVQIFNALVVRVAKLESHTGAALSTHQPGEIIRRIQRGVHLFQLT